jgi:N-glycosylase/DNA lyase
MKYISIEQLSKIIDYHKVMKTYMAKDINESYQRISRALTGKNEMSVDLYFKIIDYLDEKKLLEDVNTLPYLSNLSKMSTFEQLNGRIKELTSALDNVTKENQELFINNQSLMNKLTNAYEQIISIKDKNIKDITDNKSYHYGLNDPIT